MLKYLFLWSFITHCTSGLTHESIKIVAQIAGANEYVGFAPSKILIGQAFEQVLEELRNSKLYELQLNTLILLGPNNQNLFSQVYYTQIADTFLDDDKEVTFRIIDDPFDSILPEDNFANWRPKRYHLFKNIQTDLDIIKKFPLKDFIRFQRNPELIVENYFHKLSFDNFFELLNMIISINFLQFYFDPLELFTALRVLTNYALLQTKTPEEKVLYFRFLLNTISKNPLFYELSLSLNQIMYEDIPVKNSHKQEYSILDINSLQKSHREMKKTCNFCLQEDGIEELVCIQECYKINHQFWHKECLFELLNHNYKNKIFPILCPDGSCQKILISKSSFLDCGFNEDQAFQITSENKTYLEKSNKKVFTANCQRTPLCLGKVIIETGKLQSFLKSKIKKENIFYLPCPLCKTYNCWKCAKDHSRGECMNEQDWESMMKLKAISKPCPKCATPIEKNGGCNHMKCQKCNFEFEWTCLMPWKEYIKLKHKGRI